VKARFGFTPDTSVSAFCNAVRLLRTATANENNNHLNLPIPSNLAFHDLTPTKCAPDTAKALWGLGSKFIRTPYYTNGDVSASLKRLERGCYLKVYFGEDNELEQDTKLYVPSNWTPKWNDIPPWVDARLSKFFARVRQLFRQRKATSNLLPFQQRLFDELVEHPFFLFPDADKGLGPYAVTYDQYVTDCLIHLTKSQSTNS
jgi:hypothetical protein